MAKVIAPEGFELELDSERMTFGHSEEVEVPLLPELGVAERHFTIVRFGQKHFIEHGDDAGKQTRVNGEAISRQPLEDGDEICAGDLVLVFTADEDGSASEPPAADVVAPEQAGSGLAEEPLEKPPLFDPPQESTMAPAPISAPAAEELPPPVSPEPESQVLDKEAPPELEPSENEATAADQLPAPPPTVEAADPLAEEVPSGAAIAGSDEAPEETQEAAPEELQPVELPPEEQVEQAATAEVPSEAPPTVLEQVAPTVVESLPAETAVESPTLQERPEPEPAPTENLAPTAIAEAPGATDSDSDSDSPSPLAPTLDLQPATEAPATVPTSAGQNPEIDVSEVDNSAETIPEVVPVEEVSAHAPAKPGHETQRINLASAISMALTPSTITGAEPSIAPPSNVEQIEQRTHQPPSAPQSTPPPSTSVPGPPPGAMRAVVAPPAATSSPSDLPGPPSTAVAGPTTASPSTPQASQTGSAIPQPIPGQAPAPSPSAVVAPSSIPAAPLAAAATLGAPVPGVATPTSQQETTDEPEPSHAATKPKRPAKAITPPKRKRPRRPLFPFLRVVVPGLFTLALLLGGAYYAWENHFKPEEQPREFVNESKDTDSFPSSGVNAQDVLRYLPNDAERAAYVDVRTAFSVWTEATNPSGEPVYNPIDDFISQATGVGLADLDYVCVGGDALLDKFVAVAGFAADLNPAELLTGIERSGSRLVRVEQIGEIPLRVLYRDGREIELVLIDPRTILLSSTGGMRQALGRNSRAATKHGATVSSIANLISGGTSAAMTGTPGAMQIVPTLESLGCQIDTGLREQIGAMESIAVAVTASNKLELSISFTAKTTEQATAMTPAGSAWLAQVPQMLRERFAQEFPSSPLPGAFDRLFESAEWATARKVNRIRLSLPRSDIGKLAEGIKSFGEGSSSEDNELVERDAANFSSMFDSAIEMGNPDLPKAGSVDKALEMLVEGVRGRDGFSDTTVRFPFEIDEIQLQAIARLLEWRDNRLVLRGKRDGRQVSTTGKGPDE